MQRRFRLPRRIPDGPCRSCKPYAAYPYPLAAPSSCDPSGRHPPERRPRREPPLLSGDSPSPT
uniref:Uncharacterized protein n=1 Tax=Rhizophora mucronata TaxID=61149 RepID=A0A2P2P6W5_RHIMU